MGTQRTKKLTRRDLGMPEPEHEGPNATRPEEVIQLLRALHAPEDTMAGRTCAGCLVCDPFEAHEWPCPTINIIEGRHPEDKGDAACPPT